MRGSSIFLVLSRHTTLLTVQFKSKLTLNSRSSRESSRESSLDSWLLRLDSRFLRDSSSRNGLFLESIERVLFRVICSLHVLSIISCCQNLQPLFKFGASSKFSRVKKKIFLLHKITNSTQRLSLSLPDLARKIEGPVLAGYKLINNNFFNNRSFQRHLISGILTNPVRVTLTRNGNIFGKNPRPISLLTYYSLKIKFAPFLKS